MPEKKPHLFFRNPVEGVEIFHQPVRNPGILDEDDKKNYDPMKEDFIRCRDAFYVDRTNRIQRRNLSLNVPAHVDYIELHFFDSFNSGKFENAYRTKFGLAPVIFKEFNSMGVFAIVDNQLFNNFIAQLELFINTDNHSDDVPYDKLIVFINEFYFHSTERIIEFQELKRYVVLNLVKNPELFQTFTSPIENSLVKYLEQNSIEFTVDNMNERVELLDIQNDRLIEIIDNYDIVHSVNSYSAGIVRPSPFNIPIREYGFYFCGQ